MKVLPNRHKRLRIQKMFENDSNWFKWIWCNFGDQPASVPIIFFEIVVLDVKSLQPVWFASNPSCRFVHNERLGLFGNERGAPVRLQWSRGHYPITDAIRQSVIDDSQLITQKFAYSNEMAKIQKCFVTGCHIELIQAKILIDFLNSLCFRLRTIEKVTVKETEKKIQRVIWIQIDILNIAQGKSTRRWWAAGDSSVTDRQISETHSENA